MIDLTQSIWFTESQWETTINETILDGASLNLLDLVDDVADKSSFTDKYDELHIIVGDIKTKFYGSKTEHLIRLSFDITTGNTQFYRVELRRTIDDSVVTSHNIFRNPDETRQTVNIITRTISPTDPFVVDGGGFYIAFVNNSGLSASITGSMQLLIVNQYQRRSK